MGLSIIHFSDIHIKSVNDSFVEKTDQVINSCLNTISNKDNVVIIVSGDIAFSGKKEQYDIMKSFVNQLQNALNEKGNKNITFIYVPGNHDCDFSVKSNVRESLINNIEKTDVDNEVYNICTSVQKEFYSFIDAAAKDMVQVKEIDYLDKKIGFLLINTAWMSSIHEVYGKIVIPKNFYKNVDLSKYEIVFSVYHHPSSWQTEESRRSFNDYIRSNSDIILVGHEHFKDGYSLNSKEYNLRCYKAKELQNSDNCNDSGFGIYRFNDDLNVVCCYDFTWDNNKYLREEKEDFFEKNKCVENGVNYPNNATKVWLSDLGFTVNHFAKEDVTLLDLFVWPKLKKKVYLSDGYKQCDIIDRIDQEIKKNKVSIVRGASTSGKTAFSKMMYLSFINDGDTCIFITGNMFKSSDIKEIEKIVEREYCNQYSEDKLDSFRSLEKNHRAIIVDDFDNVPQIGGRKRKVLDYLIDRFEKVIISISSELEETQILLLDPISKLESIFTYEIRPFGNTKRKELVTKWYNLNNLSKTDDEIIRAIDNGLLMLDKFLGNNTGLVPAYPFYIINALQNLELNNTNSISKYGFLYETMVHNSLTRVSKYSEDNGLCDIDVELMSKLAFEMLENKVFNFSFSSFDIIAQQFSQEKLISVSSEVVLARMKEAKIISENYSEGDNYYSFKYPYIFYFFTGRYISRNLTDKKVKDIVDKMSSKLYIEAYGNIMLFVCHFVNSKEIIETILLSSYFALDNYSEFDYYQNSNSAFIGTDIAMLTNTVLGGNEEVEANKTKKLERMDDLGINDGSVSNDDYQIVEINDDDTKITKDLAAITAALKTMEVLGEIIQNYPGGIDGTLKIEIVKNIYKLGMRAVEAMAETMDGLIDEFSQFIYDRSIKENKMITKEKSREVSKRFIDQLIFMLVRGMVDRIASSINSKHLSNANKKALEAENSFFAQLVLIDLQFNYYRQPSFDLVNKLKTKLNNEKNATSVVVEGVLKQIVTTFLKYNKCDYQLRQRLTSLLGIKYTPALLINNK